MLARTTSLVPLALLLTLGACSSEESTPAPAPQPQPQTVSFDTFNVFLAGAFSAFEAERRQPLVDAIAALDSDIICLQEAWRDTDKEALAAAAQARFPNVVLFKDNLDTPVDDPADQQGKIPAARTSPACGDMTADVDEILTCAATNCSTIPGSQDGMTSNTMCLVKSCAASASKLLFGTAEQKKCYGCMAPLLPTDTFKQIREKCTTDLRAGIGFEGQAGVMLLSKFPLKNVEQRVLPGTWNRRVILRATAQIPNGAVLDVYCNHLTSVYTQLAYPYTGDYGKGESGAAGWQNELLLQAEKLSAWVETKTGTGRAIVLGDFNTSPRSDPDQIEEDSPAVLELLRSKFPEALPSGFKPACTFCGKGENVLAADPTNLRNTWIDHLFLKNIAASEVQSYSRTFTQPTVPVPNTAEAGEDAGPTAVPLSDHFGVHTVINITP